MSQALPSCLAWIRLWPPGLLALGLFPCAGMGQTGAPATTPVLPSERSVYTDAETGWPVVRLTQSAAEDIKIYQTHPSWTADGEWIVFHSTRTGTPQLFAVHEASGVLVPLTSEPGVQVGQVCLSRERAELLTLIGNQVVVLDFGETLREALVNPDHELPPVRHRAIATLPPGAALSGTISWNASETILYAGLQESDGSGADAYCIAGLHLDGGVWQTVYEPEFRVGHVQANPWSDDWLMYCHETGGDAPQRMWRLRTDGTQNGPFHVETFEEWVTHELWWNSTQALFTVWPKDAVMSAKPHGLASVGLDAPVRFHSRFPYWHVTGAAGSPYLVADTFDGQIIRVHAETGERVILTQGHRLGRQGAHPHPTLNSKGDKVLFNSNRDGQADLYLISLEGPVSHAEHAYRNRRFRGGGTAELPGWQEKLRAELRALLKIDDLWAQTLPLGSRVVANRTERAMMEQEVELRSTPHRRITARMTLPARSSSPVPAVVCMHGHGGDRSIVYDSTSIYKGFAQALAEKGWATIAVDIGQHEIYETGRTLMGERLWDLKRCVDYLEACPDVDASRIGCAGLSLGGEMAMWLGATDPRIRATVSSGFLTTMDQMEQNHCMCWKLPGLRELVDYADIYALIAPRPLLCQNGRQESPTDFWVPLAQSALMDIRGIYALAGQRDLAQLVVHDGGHEIDLPSLLEFFERHLW